MIVDSARKAIEMGHKNNIDYVNWEYLSLSIEDTIYRIIFQKHHYDSSVRQWMINENIYSFMQSKHWEDSFKTYPKFLYNDVCNTLGGIRAFEYNSMVWECLFKPMGLKWREKMRSTSPIDLIDYLNGDKIEYKILFNDIF